MTTCDRCKKLAPCIECWICTDQICERCERDLHYELDLGNAAILECIPCVLALTPEGNLHRLTLKYLRNKEEFV